MIRVDNFIYLKELGVEKMAKNEYRGREDHTMSLESSANDYSKAFCLTLLERMACFNLKLCLSSSSNSSSSLRLRASRLSKIVPKAI